MSKKQRRPRRSEPRYTKGVPAVVGTTSQWRSGVGYRDEFDGDAKTRRRYEAMARANGVNPTGKKYISQMARFPGDPTAWHANPDDIRRICERRGWAYRRGHVNVKMREPEPPPAGPYRVADDLVEQEVIDIVEKQAGGKISRKEYKKLKEQMAKRLAGADGED